MSIVNLKIIFVNSEAKADTPTPNLMNNQPDFIRQF